MIHAQMTSGDIQIIEMAPDSLCPALSVTSDNGLALELATRVQAEHVVDGIVAVEILL